jgi:NDP-sugar pyrophosphorylase family protein
VSAPPRVGGIIAAGEGSRLRQAGFTIPKPMVPIAGVPLIESVIRNFRAAGIASLVVIVNEAEQAIVDWARSRFADLDVEFIVKTTPSSLASFREVTARRPGGRMLVSTVDAWCRAGDFVRFVEAASRRAAEATVLAVTPLVADERPVRVQVDAAGRVQRLGEATGDLVTAGIYLVSERVRTQVPPPGLGRLREFLAWLCRTGEPLYGEVVETVVDVDRAADVAIAEALALAWRVS